MQRKKHHHDEKCFGILGKGKQQQVCPFILQKKTDNCYHQLPTTVHEIITALATGATLHERFLRNLQA